MNLAGSHCLAGTQFVKDARFPFRFYKTHCQTERTIKVNRFYHNVDTVGAGDNFKARVDVLAVEETVAVVRVLEEGWGGRIDFTDFLLLLKLDGEWKCVAKAYNQNSDTIKK
ncbi:MAG: nuclear transport factor 2 family protein [Duncaniella sp.]|nr:nuclear transport factor 2 family protein [Duncaniella sp.]